jgi:hypothetical protein
MVRRSSDKREMWEIDGGEGNTCFFAAIMVPTSDSKAPPQPLA